MQKILLIGSLLIMVFTVSCKKNNGGVTPPPVTPPVINKDSLRLANAINNYKVEALPSAPTQLDLTADSAYLFSKEVYLWNTKYQSLWGDSSLVEIKYDKFNPRQYKGADLIETADNVMMALRPLSGTNIDRFSFATSKEESDGIQTGQAGDYGFWVKAAYINATDIKWFVTYTYKDSPAGKAGVTRGWILNKINGTLLDYSDTSFDILNGLLFGNASSASLEFLKGDGSPQTLLLTKAEYQANSVLLDSVFTLNSGKKVGYLVFNSFFGLPSRQELVTSFNKFINSAITELIVDLRNNLGGSTETQDMLANIIAPQNSTGKVMYQYEFNPLMQNDKFPLLKARFGWSNGSFALVNNTTKFNKTGMGSLNLSQVFFITTSNSASASELLINNLRTVMNVRTIGSTTRGKPVGYFPIELFNKVAFYAASFRTINAAGSSDYYTGIKPDKEAGDGVNLNWGNPNDPCLKQALNYISTGSYIAADPGGNTVGRSVYQGEGSLSNKLDGKRFSGMFIEPGKKR